MAWFQLSSGGDASDPQDYNATGSPSCSGSVHICAIQATADDDNKPVFTTPLLLEMITALNTGSNQTNVILRTTA